MGKVSTFFNYWACRKLAPINESAKTLDSDDRLLIKACDLRPGENLQGISFEALEVTQADVESLRKRLVSKPTSNPNYLRRIRENKEKEAVPPSRLPIGDVSHFRFRSMNLQHKPLVPHFQLRHTLSASCKNAVFYARGRHVYCYNSESDVSRRVLEVKSADVDALTRVQGIGCLKVKNDLLIAGDEHGRATLKYVSSSYDEHTENILICDGSPQHRMLNHVSIYDQRRSGLPQATFCPNDSTIRTLDCQTSQIIYKHTLDWPANCSAISPDGRLRLVVGDGCEPLVMDAEKGNVIYRLPNHDDYGFACDIADNGIYMATGNQDGKAQIWDCRNFSQPLQVIEANTICIRSVQFSPVGSGRRVLIMADDVDSISVVDATTFQSQQQFDFLGDISGISLVPEGDKLFVGISDSTFGGIAEFDRCDYGFNRQSEEIYHTWEPDEVLGDKERIRILDPSSYQDWASFKKGSFPWSNI